MATGDGNSEMATVIGNRVKSSRNLRKTGLSARFSYQREAGNHLPEGNSCQLDDCNLGGWTTGMPTVSAVCSRAFARQHEGSHVSHARVARSITMLTSRTCANNFDCAVRGVDLHSRSASRAFAKRMSNAKRHQQGKFVSGPGVRKTNLTKPMRILESLKVPALRLGDEEVAKDLYACNRLQLFRIDEIGIERG